jgi:hypothetical protein
MDSCGRREKELDFIVYDATLTQVSHPSIEIELEQAPFFSSFEHVKSLLIIGPNNTKNSSLK